MRRIAVSAARRAALNGLDKHHQIEILKILSKNMCKINENKSGVFVNMTFLDEKILSEIHDYLKYMKEQEDNLNPSILR